MRGIHEHEVRTLLEANAIHTAQVIADGDRWYVVLRLGTTERVLASKRRHRREYRDLDRLVGRLRELGIGRFEIDATHYSQQQAAQL